MKNPYSSFRLRFLYGHALIFLGLIFCAPLIFPHVLESESPPVILAFGDSLTAGYGVQERESYPARLQDILRKHGYPHRVINAGVSGDTTAGGVRRIRWLLQHDPRVVILALGANDGLRGLSVTEMYDNLKQIIELCREHRARVLLAGMKIPPNYGEAYSRAFEEVYTTLAGEFDLPLLPFILEGVAAKREYTQPDGIHPLGPGYEIVADTVWKYIEPMIAKSPSANNG